MKGEKLLKFAVTLLVVSSAISCEEKKAVVSEPEKMVNSFFDTYKTSGPREAVHLLLSPNKYIREDSVGVKLENLANGLGDLHGIEKIREKTYGESLVLLTYIVKYSQQPIRFSFKFYQPGNGWRIQSFFYEPDFIDEMDETIKPYRLKENHEN